MNLKTYELAIADVLEPFLNRPEYGFLQMGRFDDQLTKYSISPHYDNVIGSTFMITFNVHKDGDFSFGIGENGWQRNKTFSEYLAHLSNTITNIPVIRANQLEEIAQVQAKIYKDPVDAIKDPKARIVYSKLAESEIEHFKNYFLALKN